MRGLSRRQANVLAFALDRQDARRPVAVDQPCALCERAGTPGDPVVIWPGQPHGMHQSCAEAHAARVKAIQARLTSKETTP